MANQDYGQHFEVFSSALEPPYPRELATTTNDTQGPTRVRWSEVLRDAQIALDKTQTRAKALKRSIKAIELKIDLGEEFCCRLKSPPRPQKKMESGEPKTRIRRLSSSTNMTDLSAITRDWLKSKGVYDRKKQIGALEVWTLRQGGKTIAVAGSRDEIEALCATSSKSAR